MIDYNELDKFYMGIAIPVLTNAGGMFLELGEDINTLFYKLNDDYYADVNHKGRIAQVLRKKTIVTSSYIVPESSLTQVRTKEEINKHTNLVKRLTFKPSNYIKK